MAKKSKQEAKQLIREDLFQDFLQTTYSVLGEFECWFEVDGVRDHFFGTDRSESLDLSVGSQANEAASNHVRSSLAWQALSALHDYAVEGVATDEDTAQIVLDGGQVVALLHTHENWLCDEWERLVWQADGRRSLDTGSSVMVEKLAFLAGVDPRTVRNAISAGELVAFKQTVGLDPGTYVENASARGWLQGRRGFKPTVFRAETALDIEDVRSPTDFAAFLKARREQLGLNVGEGKVRPLVPGVDARSLEDVEGGVFTLPISAVNPLADFYQLDRKAFLDCVMRVFFAEYYEAILELRNVKGG